jgi:NAD dependent epimerase/dehydratase
VSWSGQKVLVTGADGFIGSHLVERLAGLGADVRAFCFYNSSGSWGWLDGSDPSVKRTLDVRLGDIRDSRFVEAAAEGIDVVFHLAALISIPYSYSAPESFVDTNVKGTLNVLEAVRRAGCRRVVHTSTSEVYGTPAVIPIRETHPLQGQSPYSASKIAADKLCEAYHASYGVPVVTLRPFNTYGPRQSTRAVLPTMLVQLLAGQTDIRLGRLDTKRDLTFVADTVEGFVRAGEAAGIEGEVIQLGTGCMLSIGEIFETACRVRDETRLRPDASEVEELLSDPAKAREHLGWAPAVPLEDGLALTALWLKDNLHLYNTERHHV